MTEIDPNTIYLPEWKVSERTGMSRNTLSMWRWKGKGPPFVKLGRAVRYPESGLIAWLNQQQRQA